jgi:hypothetical protein
MELFTEDIRRILFHIKWSKEYKISKYKDKILKLEQEIEALTAVLNHPEFTLDDDKRQSHQKIFKNIQDFIHRQQDIDPEWVDIVDKHFEELLLK